MVCLQFEVNFYFLLLEIFKYGGYECACAEREIEGVVFLPGALARGCSFGIRMIENDLRERWLWDRDGKVRVRTHDKCL